MSAQEVQLTPGSLKFIETFYGNPKAWKQVQPPSLRDLMETSLRRFGGSYQSVPCVEDIALPTLDSPTKTFLIRVYWPHHKTGRQESQEPVPVLLHAHGGGWLRGSINTADQLCRHLVNQAKCAVVSVDYRLAPEHKFPCQPNDVAAAYQWIVDRPDCFDTTKIIVSGDSAGGNLTSALIVRLSTTTLPRPLAQILIYPTLDLRFGVESFTRFGQGFGLDTELMLYYRKCYLGTDESSLLETPEVSPILHPDPTIFPPTLLVSAEVDPLVDDAYTLKDRLEQAGVPVEHVVYKGVVHAFINFYDMFPESAEATEVLSQYVRRRVGSSST